MPDRNPGQDFPRMAGGSEPMILTPEQQVSQLEAAFKWASSGPLAEVTGLPVVISLDEYCARPRHQVLDRAKGI